MTRSSLSAAMAQLIADPERRARMRTAGLKRVRRFAIETMVSHYADLFEEMALVPAR